MGRKYEYINIYTPKIRAKPSLSHDLQLQRDLEISNARTLAELGPLPPGGLPVVTKQKCVPPQSVAMPEHEQANFENQEDEAMKLSQVVAVTAVAAGIVACEPSTGTEETPHPPATTITPADAKQESPTTASTFVSQSEVGTATPISANAAISEVGELKVKAGDITLHLTVSGCSKQSDTLTICDQGASLHITKTGADFSQTLQLKSVHVDSRETLYRGALNESNYHTFILADVNGDDQEDLIVQTGNEGGYGGSSFSVYLFDIKDKMFNFNKLFSDLTIGASSLFIVENGKLKTWAKDGCCEHFYFTYEIRNDCPVLIERVTKNSSEKEVKTVVERLVNGEMKKISHTAEAAYLPKGETNSIHSFSPTESVEDSNDRLRSSYAQCLNAAGGATWSMQDCIEKEWDYQDARLNAVYQQLKAKLPKAKWRQLQAEQRKWITDTDHNEGCKWDAATEGQAQRIAANECTLLQVASRADKLEKLLATESKMP